MVIKKHKFWYGIWEVWQWDRRMREIYHEIIQNALADEGEQNLLDLYFRALNAPSSFYLGLCNDAGIVDTDTLATILGEPVGNGYSRQAIARNSVDWPTFEMDAGDWQVTSKLVTFTAAGGTIGPVNNMFLTNGGSGTTGAFLAWAALSSARTMPNGESLGCKIKIKLQ